MKATMAWRCHACDDLVKDYLCVPCLSKTITDSSKSEPEDVVEIEDMVKPEDETVPASVHEVDLGNEVRSSVEEGTAAMENLVRKLGNAEEEAECKKLKKELEEAKEFVFEERPNEVIDVSVEDEKSPSPEPRGSPRNS
ncbi:hypothetical protein Tco_0879491 [Tanacetum coccineum]